MNNLELAKLADVWAIASTISEKINLTVKPKLQYGRLILKVNTTDIKICAQIIQSLNEIQPNIESVQILGSTWSRFYVLKSGKYVENTNTVVVVGIIMVGLFGVAIALNNPTYQQDQTNKSIIVINYKFTIAFISLVKYDDNLYGKIKAVHLLKYKNETIFLRLSPKNI